ncbi:MAG: hypothetical protein ACFFD1_15040 [Candidatus Thorarchaeota archaeon]
MFEITKNLKNKSRIDQSLPIVLFSSFSFSFIAYFTLLILAKIQIIQIPLNSEFLGFLIFFSFLIPFVAGSVFSLVIDRSIQLERVQKNLIKTNCVICSLPLRSNVFRCISCDSGYHSWHFSTEVSNSSEFFIERCLFCHKKNSFYSPTTKTNHQQNKIIIIDGTNLACETKPPSLFNINLAEEFLVNLGFDIICFVSPALKYRIKEKEKLLEKIKFRQIIQTPAGSYDDRFILETAKRFNAYILSNDKFSDLNEYQDFIKPKKMTFSIINDDIIIDLSNYQKNHNENK